jgi:type II secretory pathway component GspD/PulD (secretin)
VLPNKESSITQDARFLYVIRGTTLYKVQKSDLKVVKTGALDQVDIREALHELFSSVNASYTVDPQVQGSVTLDFKNVLFETALQQVLRQVGATYRIMDGTFQIVHKQDNIAPNYENPKP